MPAQGTSATAGGNLLQMEIRPLRRGRRAGVVTPSPPPWSSDSISRGRHGRTSALHQLSHQPRTAVCCRREPSTWPCNGGPSGVVGPMAPRLRNIARSSCCSGRRAPAKGGGVARATVPARRRGRGGSGGGDLGGGGTSTGGRQGRRRPGGRRERRRRRRGRDVRPAAGGHDRRPRARTRLTMPGLDIESRPVRRALPHARWQQPHERLPGAQACPQLERGPLWVASQAASSLELRARCDDELQRRPRQIHAGHGTVRDLALQRGHERATSAAGRQLAVTQSTHEVRPRRPRRRRRDRRPLPGETVQRAERSHRALQRDDLPITDPTPTREPAARAAPRRLSYRPPRRALPSNWRTSQNLLTCLARRDAAFTSITGDKAGGLSVFDLDPNGVPTGASRPFAGVTDGVAMDCAGDLYLSSAGGIVNSAGVALGSIPGGGGTHATFGGD